jgi:hypothetical protein
VEEQINIFFENTSAHLKVKIWMRLEQTNEYWKNYNDLYDVNNSVCFG